MRSHRRSRSLSREPACEFGDTGEEKCKCSSLEVSDMASMGRWMCVRERREMVKERDLGRERDGADSLCICCVSPCLDAHRCERTCLSSSENRWHSLRRMLWSFSLFTYFSSFLCLSFASVTCLRLVVLKDADVGCTFSLFSIPFLPSSSLQVPCCFSCIVRLQVVWEQDLWEHMRVSETPQLTWLLRRGDKKKRNRGRWRPKWCREKCNALPPLQY